MAFQSELGEAKIILRAETKKFQSELKKAQKQTAASTKKMGASMAAFASKAKIALLAVSAAFVAGVRSAVRYADQIDKMAVKTGLALDTVQKLKFASDQLGFSFQLVETLAFRVTRRMGEAAEGSERVAGAFADLGVNIKDSNGNFKDVNEIFPELIDKLSKMEDKAKRNALAVKIFDTEFRSLVPLIEAGAGAIEKYGKEAERLGLILDKDVNDSFVRFGDLLSTAMSQLQISFMDTFAPTLNTINALLAQFSGTELQQAETQAELLKDQINTLSEAIKADEESWWSTALAIAGFNGSTEDAKAKLEELRAKLAEVNKEKERLQNDGGGGGPGADTGPGATGGKGNSLSKRRTTLADQLKASIITLEQYRVKLEQINAISDAGPKKLVEALRAGEISVQEFQSMYSQQMDKIKSKSEEAAQKSQQAFENFASSLGSLFGGGGSVQGVFSSLFSMIFSGLGGGGDSGGGGGGGLGGLFGGLFGGGGGGGGGGLFGGFFADGGRPPLGKVSVVGENGPELFVPDGAGTIVPNGSGMSGATINVQPIFVGVDDQIQQRIQQSVPDIVEAAVGAVSGRMQRGDPRFKTGGRG